MQSNSIIETDNRKIINMNPYFSTSQISNLTLTDTMTDTSIPITMPFARPLEQVFESNMELNTTVLLQSSESASVIPYGISDEQLENWTPEEYGPFRWQSFPRRALRMESPVGWQHLVQQCH